MLLNIASFEHVNENEQSIAPGAQHGKSSGNYSQLAGKVLETCYKGISVHLYVFYLILFLCDILNFRIKIWLHFGIPLLPVFTLT